MASIEKRAATRGHVYVVRYRDDTGRQRSKSFPRRGDAAVFASKVEVELREGTYIDPSRSRVTFGSFHARWAAARSVAPSRAAAEASQARTHIIPRWGDVPLSRIRPLDVDAWVKTMDAGAPTVVMALQQFKLCLDHAVREGIIRANPAATTKPPALPRKRVTHADVLDARELDVLVAEMPDRWKALVYLSGWLGWRWSEAMGLRLRDVDLEAGVVYVGNQVAVEVGGVVHVRSGGKTAAATRTVTLPGPALDVMRWHLDRYAGEDLVFVAEGGATPMRSNFRRILQAAVKRAHLDGRGINMRQLRHTAASLMLSSGLDILDVQERLGHARGSVTLDIYGRVLASRRAAGTAVLAAAMADHDTSFTHVGSVSPIRVEPGSVGLTGVSTRADLRLCPPDGVDSRTVG